MPNRPKTMRTTMHVIASFDVREEPPRAVFLAGGKLLELLLEVIEEDDEDEVEVRWSKNVDDSFFWFIVVNCCRFCVCLADSILFGSNKQ